MIRTTIMMPEALKMRATARARNLGISLGEFVRVSIEAMTSSAGGVREEDPFFSDTTVFHGRGPTDVSITHDRYLYGKDTRPRCASRKAPTRRYH